MVVRPIRLLVCQPFCVVVVMSRRSRPCPNLTLYDNRMKEKYRFADESANQGKEYGGSGREIIILAVGAGGRDEL